jgi:hypothetical protein
MDPWGPGRNVWFMEVICEQVYSLGPFQSDGSWMEDHLDVHARAVMRELRFSPCANSPNFEIFEYQSLDQHLVPPRNSHVGGHNLAFYVETSTWRSLISVDTACASRIRRRAQAPARDIAGCTS